METTTIKLSDRTLQVVRPRFYFGWDGKENECWFSGVNDSVSGSVQQLTCWLPEGFRHISTAEFSSLMNEAISGSHGTKRLCAEILLDYLLERGVDLTDVYHPSPAIFLNDGVTLRHHIFTVVKDIDTKVEYLTEASYDTTVGHRLKNDAQVESQEFSIERLFRKYNPETLTLKQLDKANPDLTEYLFGIEYEALPAPIQQAKFILPPDLDDEEFQSHNYHGQDIWPLAVDLSFRFKEEKFNPRREPINRLALRQVTFTPFQVACGVHVTVKEITAAS